MDKGLVGHAVCVRCGTLARVMPSDVDFLFQYLVNDKSSNAPQRPFHVCKRCCRSQHKHNTSCDPLHPPRSKVHLTGSGALDAQVFYPLYDSNSSRHIEMHLHFTPHLPSVCTQVSYPTSFPVEEKLSSCSFTIACIVSVSA